MGLPPRPTRPPPHPDVIPEARDEIDFGELGIGGREWFQWGAKHGGSEFEPYPPLPPNHIVDYEVSEIDAQTNHMRTIPNYGHTEEDWTVNPDPQVRLGAMRRQPDIGDFLVGGKIVIPFYTLCPSQSKCPPGEQVDWPD